MNNFTNNMNGITFDGISNYGTTAAQNIDMPSRTIAAAEAVMVTNNTNSASGTLCPLPETITTLGTTYLNWIYP